MMTLWHDVRIAWRSLSKQPASSLMIVVILAVGIAGTTTVFNLFNGVFLRPLPIPDPARVMVLREIESASGADRMPSYPRYHAWLLHNRSFASMAFSTVWEVNVSAHGAAERAGMWLAGREFFDTFGIRPVLGRCFTEEEDQPDGPQAALISSGLWKRMFNMDPTIIGRTICLDDDPSYTIVGVVPDDTFPEHRDIWCPLRARPDKEPHGFGAMAVGRLKKGVTLQQARDDLTRIQQGWARQHPDKEPVPMPNVIPFRDVYLSMARQFRFALSVVLGVVVLVLLIACCNVASAMLARGADRSREVAVRATLGATRGRIIRSVLTESLVLSVAGGLAGVLLGHYALRVLLLLLADLVPAWMKFTPDMRFVLFCILVVFVTAVLSGLLPALHATSPRDLHHALQALGARMTASRARRRALRAVVTAQIALAMTLLAGAGLMLRTLLNVHDADPGFRTAGVLTYHVPLSLGPYLDENKRHAFWEQHIEGVCTLPGVVHAALVNNVPMSVPAIRQFESEGGLNASGQEHPQVFVRRVTPDYFATLGIPLLAGRGFTENDNRRDSERTVIVGEAFAARFWPGESPLDKRIRQRGSEDWIRVIGLVKDVRQVSLDEVPQLGVYLPRVTDAAFAMWGVVQTSGDPFSVVPAIRGILQSADPGVPMEKIQTMSKRLHDSMSTRRLALWLYGVPAMVAALLACAGIYGVTSYAVSRRTQEIGIRVALGAAVVDVLAMVVKQGLRLVLFGLGIGLAGAFVLGRLLAHMEYMLYDVSPADPATFVAVMVLLAVAALTACYLPARRAARIDPMSALRYE